MSRILTIIEVSQKQAYIFEENKLKENIARSDEIARITGVDYIAATAERDLPGEGIFSEEKNLVYSGGGHTILEFPDRESSSSLVRVLTKRVLEEVPGIALFAATREYDEQKTPGENVKLLTADLERKKSIRRSFFHQGTYGIERVDRNTGKPVEVRSAELPELPEREEVPPKGFLYTAEFDKLGGTRNEKNFIAIVHIDGNAMGKRVEELSERYPLGKWEEYKAEMRRFSESIATDFKAAYREMEQYTADVIWNGGLDSLSLTFKKDHYYLPVRRIISEGDDICFVSDGRIGIECAAAFLRFLAKRVNAVDGKPYAACAGVALVHQKYPFYRGYELAEELCSHAKRFGATLDPEHLGAAVSAIDWHIEYGEMRDSLEDTREQYRTADGKKMELRPYIVLAPEEILAKEPVRQYDHCRELMKRLTSREDAYGRGALKNLRSELRRGSAAVSHYLRFHQIEELGRDAWYGIYVPLDPGKTKIGSGKGLEHDLFVKTADGVERSILFDAIELMDAWLPLEGAWE